MARPPKEGMDYFPHDCNAASEKKIEALRAIHGNDGYAFYFIMLEQIYQEPNFEINVSDEETREETFLILTKKVGVNLEKFKQILTTALKWGCFDKKLYEEQGIITSNGIKKRASVVTEKREKMRRKYQQQKHGVSNAETPSETEKETPQSKEKESKEKESKDSILSASTQEILFEENTDCAQEVESEPRKKQKFSADAKEVAKYLQTKMRTAGVEHFPRDWLLKNYAVADRLLKDINKENLMQCIDWAMMDKFWQQKTNDLLGVEKAYMQWVRDYKKNKVVNIDADRYKREAYRG